jgi:putative transposase
MEPSKVIKEYKEELAQDENDRLTKLVGKITIEKEWLEKKLKSLGLPDKKQMIEPKLKNLSLSQQCQFE